MQEDNFSGVATTHGALTYYENHVLRPSLQLFFDRSALLNAASIRALRHFCLHPTSDVTPLMTQHVAPPCRVFDAIFSERQERGGGFQEKEKNRKRSIKFAYWSIKAPSDPTPLASPDFFTQLFSSLTQTLLIDPRKRSLPPPPPKILQQQQQGPPPTLTFHFRYSNDLLGYGSSPRRPPLVVFRPKLSEREQKART